MAITITGGMSLVGGASYASEPPPPSLSLVQFLLVAGGGSGGSRHAGGGGAGGYISNVTYPITLGTQYTIVVGGGAASVTGSPSTLAGLNGANTYISSPALAANITAVGGGAGAAAAPQNAGNGGSGGGGGGFAGVFGTGYGFPSPTQQGFPGGPGSQGANGYDGNGGGGAGGTAIPSGAGGGKGGVGLYNSISGSNVAYAGGGSSRTDLPTGIPGGLGGGGNGGNDASIRATAGNVNTGGGGGGDTLGQPGRAGGSGIAIIRYPDTYAVNATVTGSPNVIYANANIIYRFWQSGTIQFI